jgi:uncharacterized protein with HEPN domain
MNSPALRARDFLGHMLQAARLMQQFTEGKTEADFLSDLQLQHSVFYNVEVLGEAAKNFLRAYPNASSDFPGIPFAAIYATRNQISHGYFSVNPSRVWQVVQQDIPQLLLELEAALNTLETNRPTHNYG